MTKRRIKVMRKVNKKIEHKFGSFASNRLYDSMSLSQRVFSNIDISMKIFGYKQEIDRLEVVQYRRRIAHKLSKYFNPPLTTGAKRAGINRCTDEYRKRIKRTMIFRKITGKFTEIDCNTIRDIPKNKMNTIINRKIVFAVCSRVFCTYRYGEALKREREYSVRMWSLRDMYGFGNGNSPINMNDMRYVIDNEVGINVTRRYRIVANKWTIFVRRWKIKKIDILEVNLKLFM